MWFCLILERNCFAKLYMLCIYNSTYLVIPVSEVLCQEHLLTSNCSTVRHTLFFRVVDGYHSALQDRGGMSYLVIHGICDRSNFFI